MARLTVDVNAQDHTQGDADAPCTLVEYGDYQCPSCRQAFGQLQRVRRHFGDRLRFVYRNFPLEQHPLAEPAAETAEFAATQNRFWEMHDALYEHQPEFNEELFGKLAQQLGLDSEAVEKAIEEGKFTDRIEADMESGEASGVHGTPTFYINGRQHEGDFGAQALIQAIEAANRG